ncbi:C-C motif chemokine 4-like [Paramisgurnus dabryanus]|uniref:C-C motif chemokine 4-like n=1 Tax=Paramisgurnus dabryanus TaxID=90735 RepID=UPI0031F3B1A1
MRHLMALMFLVIFCSLQLTTSAPAALDKSICCYEFSNAAIPLKLVKSFYRTSSKCSKPAIVFETDKRLICVDPETSWVSKHIAKVDMKTSTSTTTTITTVQKPKPTQSL